MRSCSRCVRTGRRRIPITTRKDTSPSAARCRRTSSATSATRAPARRRRALRAADRLRQPRGAARFEWGSAAAGVRRAACARREPPAPDPATGRRGDAAGGRRRPRRGRARERGCSQVSWRCIRSGCRCRRRSRSTTPRCSTPVPSSSWWGCWSASSLRCSATGTRLQDTLRADSRTATLVSPRGGRPFGAGGRPAGGERDPAGRRAAPDSVL